MTLPQSSGADPGHHHHQAGQVRALVAGEAGHIDALVAVQAAGHIGALVVGQLRHVAAAGIGQPLRHQLLSETSLQLSKPEKIYISWSVLSLYLGK